MQRLILITKLVEKKSQTEITYLWYPKYGDLLYNNDEINSLNMKK